MPDDPVRLAASTRRHCTRSSQTPSTAATPTPSWPHTRRALASSSRRTAPARTVSQEIRAATAPIIALRPRMTSVVYKTLRSSELALTHASWDLDGTAPDGTRTRLERNRTPSSRAAAPTEPGGSCSTIRRAGPLRRAHVSSMEGPDPRPTISLEQEITVYKTLIRIRIKRDIRALNRGDATFLLRRAAPDAELSSSGDNSWSRQFRAVLEGAGRLGDAPRQSRTRRVRAGVRRATDPTRRGGRRHQRPAVAHPDLRAGCRSRRGRAWPGRVRQPCRGLHRDALGEGPPVGGLPRYRTSPRVGRPDRSVRDRCSGR